MVSRPDMLGISTSRVMRSGLSCGILAKAKRPSEAVPASSMPGSEASVSLSTLRMTMESSTTRMRMGGIGRY